MNLKLPKQDGAAKVSSVLQFLLFAGMFAGLTVLAWKLFDSTLVRVLCLIPIYIITSLVLYCVIRPLCGKLEDAARRRKR